MTAALCTGCGSMKFGAWLPCKKCGIASTGNRDLDIFMSDHYLDEPAMAFLSSVISKLEQVAADPRATQMLFIYYASRNLPGLMKVDVDANTRGQMDAAIGAAEIPTLPTELVFRFDLTREKRKAAEKPRWKFW